MRSRVDFHPHGFQRYARQVLAGDDKAQDAISPAQTLDQL